MEPELGLGIVRQADNRMVEIYFPASETVRKYAVADAPLKRVVFKSGDTIHSRDGRQITVASVETEDGLFIYHGENETVPEPRLSDHLSFTTPLERLLSGFTDRNRDFALRRRTLRFRHQFRQSRVRGFLGGRIDLIPHQLYVAHQVAGRRIPRVLLSDETGLGKTIEVCLVLHRLLVTERISRVLIAVPHSLVHQWFVELLRRFNLLFTIVDREYAQAVKKSDANPFLETQLALCSIDFLATSPAMRDAAVAAGWDMLVMDEAHHLTEGSTEYELAGQLSNVSGGIMLLTATPEQLGHRSHFLRLRLLDPARYHNFERFEREEKQYEKISGIAGKLLEAQAPDAKDLKVLAEVLPEKFGGKNAPSAEDLLSDEDLRRRITAELLDRHGTGRAVFRNTRAAMSGFPERVPDLIPLPGSAETAEQQLAEYRADINPAEEKFRPDFSKDRRITWLVQFLRSHREEKILLICRSIDKVRAIENALRGRIKVEIALFHEDLSLLQRDRNANWFASEDGAQILLCSEIGSEGRNFQFAHHLVLFDLPADPELLEQRIGRLDRIGQGDTIHIHLPYLQNGPGEILGRWYHEGLDAFRENVPGIYQIYRQTGPEILERALAVNFEGFEEYLQETRRLRQQVAGKVKAGRDRLLELNSFNPGIADELIREIQDATRRNELKKYMLDVFHFYGIREEAISDQVYRLNLALLSSAEFPLPPLKDERPRITFQRETALHHEDVEFLTWDHPMVTGAADLILGSEKGNCAITVWPEAGSPELLLEAVFVLECVAPGHLNADRFLPPTPVRILVNHLFENCSDKYPESFLKKKLKDLSDSELLENPRVKQELLPHMFKKCESLAAEPVPEMTGGAVSEMEQNLSAEIERLKALQQVNRNIRDEEIFLLEQERDVLRKALQSARLRLDSLRFIRKGSF